VSILVVTGTGTDVGKTVVTAAIAALAADRGRSVAVLKPAQTGLPEGAPGDLAEVVRLAGKVTTRELRRYPDPLAPESAARRSGLPAVTPAEAASAAGELAVDHDIVLVEGAGGLLVRFDGNGGTVADVAWSLHAPVLLVAHAGLGTLNVTTLTAEALVRRGIECIGVVVGSWPADPGLAAGAPLLGVLPAGIAALPPDRFLEVARDSLSPWLDGDFDSDVFTAANTA
jgi:dethiobiotin synthetase